MYFLFAYLLPLLYDPYFWTILIAIAVSSWASMNVNSTFRRYGNVENHNGITGTEAAQIIMSSVGINDVTIQPIAGSLTDNYNPQNKTLNLSEPVYNSTSVAAVGVAAHEVGHAIQDKVKYMPMSLRTALVPIVNLGSNLAMPLILLGIIFGLNQTLIRIGIICFATVLVFQLATLPVEFNASSRALKQLRTTGILNEDELPMGRKVLRAAALTYVAAVLSSFLQLFHLLLLFGNNNRNN